MTPFTGRQLLEKFTSRHHENKHQVDSTLMQPEYSPVVTGRQLREILRRHFETSHQLDDTHTRLGRPPRWRQAKQARDRQQAGAVGLQQARMQLRASMIRIYEYGGRILTDADFIVMWPEKCKPRPRFVPADQRENLQMRFRRPRYAAWKPDLCRREKGQQRVVELKFDDHDDTPGMHDRTPSSRSRMLALVRDDNGEDANGDFEDDFFDFEDDVDLEKDIEAARKKQTRRLGGYAVSFSLLCKLAMGISACLGGYYQALDSGGPKKELKWRRLVGNARRDICKLLSEM